MLECSGKADRFARPEQADDDTFAGRRHLPNLDNAGCDHREQVRLLAGKRFPVKGECACYDDSRTSASRMRSIACDGLSPFGQTWVQFMIVRQRYRRYTSSR